MAEGGRRAFSVAARPRLPLMRLRRTDESGEWRRRVTGFDGRA
ncbi:hypothetical protein [Streptomyces sp. P9-A2]